MSTETTKKKIKIDNGTTFGKTYTDKAVDELISKIDGGGGVKIIDISNTWSAIEPTDFKSLKFKSYLVGNMIYIEITAVFKNRPTAAMALFQNTTYIIPEVVTLPFFDGLDAKRIAGNDNKKLYVLNPVDSYKFYFSGWFTIEA